MASPPRLPPGPHRIRQTCLLLAIGTFVLLLFTYLNQPQLLDSIEGRLLDSRFDLRGPLPPSGLVSVVAIDDATLAELGRWPLDRRVMAQALQAIGALGATTIALDIVFSEPQHDPVTDWIKQAPLPTSLRQQQLALLKNTQPDQVLSRTMDQLGNIVNGHFFYQSKAAAAHIAPLSTEAEERLAALSAVDAIRSRSDDFPARTAWAVQGNLADIDLAGNGAGYFNFNPGSDGVIRDAILTLRYHGLFYPSLALKALSHYLNHAPIIIRAEADGIRDIRLGDLNIPVNEDGGLRVNYLGPAGSIPVISLLDILHQRLPPQALKDQLILLGVSAVGVYDAHSTPYGPSYPGVEIQATVIENMIQGNAITHTSLEVLTDLGSMAGIALLMGSLLPRLHRNRNQLFLSLLLLSVILASNQWAFVHYNLWINLTYPLLTWLLCYFGLTLYLNLSVERRFSVVRNAFKNYLHPDLVEQLTANPKLLRFGGDEQELSVLFSDIRSFTNLSETLQAQELSHFLNLYMDPMTRAVLDHQGTLDKYIGDAIMAIYGAPVPDHTHARKACLSALAMIDALPNIRTQAKHYLGQHPLNIGIGIHTGRMVVGNLGSSYRFNYTVIGDNVNLGSRLEGLCKRYGVPIIISDPTARCLDDGFVLRELDTVQVKGKERPVTIFELRGHRDPTHDEQRALEHWQAGLLAYRQKKWPQAIACWQAYAAFSPTDLCCRDYLEECQALQAHCPEDWTAIRRLDSK